MTRDQALAYIAAHPATFAGVTPESVLARVQSANDPDYYNPTLYVPEQTPTVAKRKPNVVGPTKKAPSPSGATSALVAPTGGHLPPLPILLALALLALGAGMTIYKVSR